MPWLPCLRLSPKYSRQNGFWRGADRMASIKKVEGKAGTSFKITVTRGTDSTGKQIRHFKTWKPDRPMTARQMEKEVQKVALEFERGD